MPRLIAILGPTASGKSDVALALAQRLAPPGEIVSCDSMQVYRGLDIGTAKPTPAERAAVPHHLLDIRDPADAYDVKQFQADALAAIRAIGDRGHRPILCGGTGLYAKALLYGFTLQPRDGALRADLQAQLAAGGRDRLLAELRAADPAVAARVAANDRYLIRALEILRLTGSAPGPSTAEPPAPCRDAIEVVLMPDPATTAARIARRTHAMFAAGWLDETRALIAAGLLHSPTARVALGYPELAAYLAGHGPATQAALDETIQTLTRRFARRQRTWFRNQHPRATRLDVSASTTVDHLVDQVLALLQHP